MKWLWIVVGLVILLGIGWYGYHTLSQRMMVPSATTQQQSSGGVFGSIQDALSKSLSLQCTFTTDNGIPTTAYIKMGAVHVDSNVGKSDAASFIMKDKKIYFWQVGSTTGTMMSVPDSTITPAAQPTGTANSGTNMMATLEKFKNSCKTAVVADSLFTPPANVKFTDMSQMMRTQTSGVPSGAPTGMSQQDIQNMMQQYKPTGAGY